jgi:O-acetyl-ADP-ribose deacetylase (regulator of RNase III)
MVKTAIEFLKNNRDTSIENVIFVLFTEESYKAFAAELNENRY